MAIVTVIIVNSKALMKLENCCFFVAVSQYFQFRTLYCLVRLNFGDY